MTIDRVGFGDKVECELWRDGKLVPPNKPKAREKYTVIKRLYGIGVVQLKPKENEKC